MPQRRGARKIDEAFEEVARLSGLNLPPTEFYSEFLKKTMAGIEAHAGAVWLRTPQGFLQLQTQANLDHVGLDKHKNARQCHNELLRQAFQTARPMVLEPFGHTPMMDGGTPAGNLTDYFCHIAPILVEDKQAIGLLEIWQSPSFDARMQRVFLNYIIQMAGYASNYVKHSQSQLRSDKEQVWLQLEQFTKQIHNSLEPSEVAYHIANSGRKLIGCDRLSVAIRPDRKMIVQAVSGADTVERRSTEMKALQRLCNAVLEWGERLVYTGTRDESLPPKVVDRLDDFLAERSAKLLVVMPLVDERDKFKDKLGEPTTQKPRTPRSMLVMECFEPPAETAPIIQRLETIAPHATTALYNALELKRIPLAWLWRPVAAMQRGLGGTTRLIIALVTLLVVGVTAAMILVPYPLKLDANGQLLPEDRRWVYPTREGFVHKFLVGPGDKVPEGHTLAVMFDPRLKEEINQLTGEINKEAAIITSAKTRIANRSTPEDEKLRLQSQIKQAEIKQRTLQQQLSAKLETNNVDADQAGYFRLVAPPFTAGFTVQRNARWTVLNTDFRENLTSKFVTPKDTPLIRLGNCEGGWEIELKIPQKHLGRVLQAYTRNGGADLDVDLLVTTTPTVTYKGKLAKSRLGGAAEPTRDDPNDNEPHLTAYVRISGPDIPAAYQIPRDQLVTGVEVHSKIRCGDHALGYSLFYGVWEFIYEKIIFFF